MPNSRVHEVVLAGPRARDQNWPGRGFLPDRITPCIQRQHVALWGLGTLVALCTAGGGALAPAPGLDPSWMAGVTMALRQGLVAGRDLTFAYGPLGFLTTPYLYYPDTAALAAVYSITVHLLACVGLTYLLRRLLPWPLAVPLAYIGGLASAYLGAAEIVVLAAGLFYLGCLHQHRSPRCERYIIVIGGLCSALHLLVKFNDGAVLLFVSAVAAWYLRPGGWRSETLLAAATANSFVILWWATGAGIGDLPRFFSRSLQVASGYSAAMGATALALGSTTVAIAALVTALLLAAKLSREGFSAHRLGEGLIVLALLFSGYKHAFVRADAGHVMSFFATVAALALVVRLPGSGAVFAVGLYLSATGMIFVLARPDVGSLVDPRDNLEALQAQLRTNFVRSERTETIEHSRQKLRAHYGLSEAMLRLLAGQTVHVDPWEATVVWAYPQLRWKPLPVFQSYSAFTPTLDRDNAEILRSEDGPTRILREPPGAIDGRNPDFEAPEAALELICRYRQLGADSRWQILGRVPNRCGAEEPISTVEVGLGEDVRVPTAPEGHIVVARIVGLDRPADQAVSGLYRARATYVKLDGLEFRLVSRTASGPLLMTAPVELGFSPPFGFQRNISEFSLRQAGFGFSPYQITVKFSSVPLSP